MQQIDQSKSPGPLWDSAAVYAKRHDLALQAVTKTDLPDGSVRVLVYMATEDRTSGLAALVRLKPGETEIPPNDDRLEREILAYVHRDRSVPGVPFSIDGAEVVPNVPHLS